MVGESALNALVEAHHRVPIVLVTGDAETAEEAAGIAPDAERLVVKQSISRFAAHNLHPEVACELIRHAAGRAVEAAKGAELPRFASPTTVEITFLTADMASMATWIEGVSQTGPRAVSFSDQDRLALYQRFVTIVHLTRGLVEE